MDSLTRVTIDFETSHLIFPTLIALVLLALGLAIVIRDRAAIAQAGSYWGTILLDMDKPRFLGTLLLTIVYFILMVPIGNLWPNTGLGFLICSVPYVFLTGLLYMYERSTRNMLPLAIIGLAAPVLVWWMFTDLFFLTLP